MSKSGVKCDNKDMHKRANYLFQAAKLVLKQDPKNVNLCRHYITTMRTVAEKHQIKFHPTIKRSFCKSCNIILVSGVTCRVRAKSKSEPHTVITCLLCGTIKRFMWRKQYRLWLDNPDAWLSENVKKAPLKITDKEEQSNSNNIEVKN